MLLERAAGLATRISEYHKLKRTADESETFHTRASQFGGISERVSRTRDALASLAKAGVPLNFVAVDGAGYAAKAKLLRAAIHDDPATISNPPFDLKNEFIDRLAGIASAADKAMNESWKAYVAQRADFGSSDVLGALAEVPQFRPNVAKIRQCRADIEGLGNGLPTDPQATVVRLNDLVAMHDAAWSELSAEDIPADVINFIRAAASDGASLMTYSDEVQGWLRSRNLLSAFRIRLR